MNKNKKLKTLRANTLLILAAVIWGCAFVFQDRAGSFLGTFSINFSRYLVGSIALIPLFFIFDRKNDKTELHLYKQKIKYSVIGGIFCGFALFAASAFQQFGISAGADPGKAGFITVMYVIIVPILGLFLKKKVGLLAWIAVIIAPIGLYFLCLDGTLKPAVSDILVFICAIIFSFHILVIDHFSPKADGVLMSGIQFFVVAVLSFICVLIFEREYLTLIPKAWLDILYLGLMSSGLGYTFQIIAQKDTNPTVASLLMSLESVFAMLFGAIYLQEIPAPRKIFGASIIFIAVILAQLPQPKITKKQRSK